MLHNFAWVTGEQNSLSRPFPASFRFYHCSLWGTFLNPRKFNIGLIQLNAWPPAKDFDTKVTMQNPYSINMTT